MIKKFLASRTQAKVQQLKLQLKSTKKSSSINSYLLEIKKVIDLIAVEAPVSTKEHIEAILDGLLSEYNSIVTSIILRIHHYSIEKMEALLLTVEAHVEKCN